MRISHKGEASQPRQGGLASGRKKVFENFLKFLISQSHFFRGARRAQRSRRFYGKRAVPPRVACTGTNSGYFCVCISASRETQTRLGGRTLRPGVLTTVPPPPLCPLNQSESDSATSSKIASSARFKPAARTGVTPRLSVNSAGVASRCAVLRTVFSCRSNRRTAIGKNHHPFPSQLRRRTADPDW